MGNSISKLTRREQYGLIGFVVLLAGGVLGGWGCSKLGAAPLKPTMPLNKTEEGKPLAAASPTPMPTPQTELLVYVSGAVKKPGVYKFKEGQRLYEAIEKAGGFLPEADQGALNLAGKLQDSDQLDVPKKPTLQEAASRRASSSRAKRASNRKTATRAAMPNPRGRVLGRGDEPVETDDDGSKRYIAAVLGERGSSTDSPVDKILSSEGNSSTSRSSVNINTADLQELQSLPGVGAVTAERIISYRETIGQFQVLEDLMEVKGIGQKTFAKLRPLITI